MHLKPGARFLLFCLFLAYGIYVIRRLEPGFTFAKYDCGWMVGTVMSIAEDGDLDLRNQLKNDPNQAADQTSMGVDAQWYPLHEYLMAFPTVPFYLLLGISGCLVFNVFIMIFLMMLLYDLCCRHVDRKSAFIAVIFSGFTTLFYDYSYSYSGDVFGCFLLVTAYWYVVREKPFLGGLVWGLAVFGRTANAITAPAFVAFLFINQTPGGEDYPASLFLRWRQWVPRLTRFSIGILPALVCYGLANWKMFGSVLTTSYSRWQLFEGGRWIIRPQQNTFSGSLIERLPIVLFDRESGMFFGAPLLFVALAFGLRPFWRQARNETILFGLVSICLIVLFSKYSIAMPGTPGNRYLMSVVALGTIPLSIAIRDALKAEGVDP